MKKVLIRRCAHQFKSDWTNDMDIMRISGTYRDQTNFVLTKMYNFKFYV